MTNTLVYFGPIGDMCATYNTPDRISQPSDWRQRISEEDERKLRIGRPYEKMAPPVPSSRTCKDCTHYGTEPDAEYPFCTHPDSGPFGKYLSRGPIPHCGPTLTKFVQPPHRTAR